MFKSVYDTLACRAFQIADIKHELEVAKLQDGIQPATIPNSSTVARNVYVISPKVENVPAFTHPILVEDRGTSVFYIDGRPYFKIRPDRSIGLSSPNDYLFQVNRAVFNLHWLESPRDLMSMGDLANIVFCRWLAGAVTKRFGLDPQDQAKVNTVTMFYWYSLHREIDEEFTEKEKTLIAQKLSQTMGVPTSLSISLIDEIGLIEGINNYVETLKHVVANPRLDNLSPGFIFAALGGSWFGLNGKEVVAAATEHLPTFYAIIFTALNDRSYVKSGLGTLVRDNDKRGRGDTFRKNAQAILTDYFSR